MAWKGHNRHVFLFRHHLVICKPRRDSRTDTFSYVFRTMMKVCGCGLRPRGQEPGLSLPSPHPADACAHLQLSSIDLNDQVEGDDRAFEVWHEREDSVRKYLLQARTAVIKSSWVKEICGIQQRLALPVWSESLGVRLGLGCSDCPASASSRWLRGFPQRISAGRGPMAVASQDP